jgi:hypothetical protein
METENRRIGTGPNEMQLGDMNCVCEDVAYLLLVRKSEREDEESLIGECYLRGYMDRDAKKPLLDGESTLQEFNLA